MSTVSVPDRARTYLLAHPDQPAKDAAAALGIAIASVWQYRHRLIRAGLLPSPRLAPAQLAEVLDRLDAAEDCAHVAAQIGTTADALRRRLNRRNYRVRDARRANTLTPAQVAAAFGYSPKSAPSLIRRLEASGLRTAHQRVGRRTHRLITVDDLMAFFERPDCPVDPATIVDPDWRAYAAAARAGHLKPVRVEDWRERAWRDPTPNACPDCGAPITTRATRCKPCAQAYRFSRAAD